MAVKVRNVANARKSQLWNEQDDVALAELLRRKIKEMTVALRECETPYERSRLKKNKDHYKAMLKKVETGSYNGDIIFNELKAAAALSQEQTLSTRAYASVSGGKIYNNSYNNMDFDYESAFRKKRYYGFALPLIMTILSALLALCFIVGFFFPKDINQTITDTIGIDFGTFVMYRIGPLSEEEDENGFPADYTHFIIPNDGNWPRGIYDADISETGWEIEDGVPFEFYPEDSDDPQVPETVDLYRDVGCTMLYIDTADIVKAWFKTKMLAKTRIDFIENLPFFQGDSVYYQVFLSGTKADDLKIQKNENGEYDFGVIYNHIGVYGTIMFTIVAFLMTIVLFVMNLIRLFTYTSRRIHGTTLFTLLMSALAMICPALASCEGTALGTALKLYFTGLSGADAFAVVEFAEDVAEQGPIQTVGLSLTYLLPAVLCVLLLILPFLFRNRFKKLPTHLPKGNKVHDPFNRKKNPQ